MEKLTRPIVLTSLCCIVCLFSMLCGFISLISAFVIGLITVSISFILLAKYDGIKEAFFLLAVTLICVFSGMFTYFTREAAAHDFIGQMQEKGNAIYEVKVTSCKTYSSYSVVDGKVISVDGKRLKNSFNCRAGCYSGEGLESGCIITFSGIPHLPENDEDELFDNISYLRSRLTFMNFTGVSVSSTEQGGKSLVNALHEHIEKTFYSFIPQSLQLDSADVSYSMLLGDKQFLSSDVKEAFTRSGIIHLLCVSGMHLSVIMGAFYSVLSLLNVSKRKTAVFLTVLCLLYLTVIGFPVSAVRAGIICIISYIAMLCGRSTDAYSSLFAAAIVICIISPYSVIDISAQLSFLSSFGIITVTELFCDKPDGDDGALSRVLAHIRLILYPNFGAVIFSLFISARSFGGISVFSIPATILTSFLCEALLVFLLILVLLSPIPFITPILSVIGHACNLCAKGIIHVANFFSNFKFAYTPSGNISVFLTIFLICTVLICVFIYLDKKLSRLITVIICMLLCIIATFVSLCGAILDDRLYTVSYFRQNENDRQLTVKLGPEGYLIINADSILCTDKNKAEFDTRYKNNYLLVIPDELVKAGVLCQSIEIFNNRYGLKGVFVPDTNEGHALKSLLEEKGCRCNIIENSLDFGLFYISFDFSAQSTFFTIDDGKTKTSILFSDEYDAEKFGDGCDIAAFFTRKTKNQFDLSLDTLPNCSTFVTRLKKTDSHPIIQNTYGKKSFSIKE